MHPLTGISSPRVPPSCWRPTAQSCRISNLVCSCSWQCRLRPQACRSSFAATRRRSCRPLPLSLPWWCCKVWTDPHSSVSGFSSSSTLNITARTYLRQVLYSLSLVKHLLNESVIFLITCTSFIELQELWVSGNLCCHISNTVRVPYLHKQLLNGPCGEINSFIFHKITLSLDLSDSTLQSRRVWYPPVLGSSCPARKLAPPTLTIRPLRGSMMDSASRTPPTGSTAPSQTYRRRLAQWRCRNLDTGFTEHPLAAFTCYWV